jgi:REP element-mobilizing transposase RayT
LRLEQEEKAMERNRYRAVLEAGGFYHIYNRANSKKDLLFAENRNYYYFLDKYVDYLYPFVETYAFCLIPNHFHFLIEVRPEEQIRAYLYVQRKWEKMREAPIQKVLSEAFRRFFICYARSFNPTDRRQRGCLFQRPFNRVAIHSTYHFFTEVFYIHNNPVKHGLVSSIEEYPWSSYLPILYGPDQHTNWLCRDKMVEWFEGEEAFKFFHKQSR